MEKKIDTISEAQARDMLDICVRFPFERVIDQWKSKGYIRKSKLEEAREFVKLNIENPIVRELEWKYEAAIKELEGK